MGVSARTAPRRRSADYHDYVFRDGKLIGDFEGMYRHADGAPWEQDVRSRQWHAAVGLAMLKEQAPYGAILEIGCGLGFIAAQVGEEMGGPGAVVEAFDVSATAVRRARRLHSGVMFYTDDIMRKGFRPRRTYDLVILRDVLWYVCQRMPVIVDHIGRCVKPGGLLYVAQSFPALAKPFVGKRVIPNPQRLVRWFSGYRPVSTALLRNHDLAQDGPIVHFLGRRAG